MIDMVSHPHIYRYDPQPISFRKKHRQTMSRRIHGPNRRCYEPLVRRLRDGPLQYVCYHLHPGSYIRFPVPGAGQVQCRLDPRQEGIISQTLAKAWD
jgi:hypothetical protein